MVNLIEKRKAKGMTQKQLADACCLKRNTITAIENRQTKSPTVENAKKIASVLDFSWTEFFED